ncbi:MAG: FAD-binding protein [Devosiaceae bacterium]|nr:FAD-binding protein [Devosiaceae bacterium]
MANLSNNLKQHSKSTRIVFCESFDQRVVKAAGILNSRKLARIVFLGDYDNLEVNASKYGVDLNSVDVVDYESDKIQEKIVSYLKKNDPAETLDSRDPVVAGAWLVKNRMADAVIAGAAATPSHVMSVFLRILGTAKDCKTMSGMSLVQFENCDFVKNKFIGMADVSVVSEPTVEQLADITLQSAANYQQLTGNRAKVGFLSFATASAATNHPSIQKIRDTIKLVNSRNPELMVDGEMQMDAALIPSVASVKCPSSAVAGSANVLIFPSLDAGNIAMNSGGAHCLKYGVTTNNLLGVTLVTMQGEIIKIGGPFLDAPAYDLLGLICGSEGQLGVVTEATLRILPKPEGARPILIGFDSNEIAGACVSDIIRAGVLPVAIEFMDRPILGAVAKFTDAGYPDVEALLIIEVEGSEIEINDQLERITKIAQKHNPVALRQSKSEAESILIWKGRKAAFGAMGQINDYMCLDGTIPVSQLPTVLRRIAEMSAEYGLEVGNVFHAGDGNMHPLILYDANKPGDLEKTEKLGAEILKLCVEVGGCLTGEHGVGVEKRELMGTQFNTNDLEAQMQIKDVFDPDWLLNPAKVFPLASSKARRSCTAHQS